MEQHDQNISYEKRVTKSLRVDFPSNTPFWYMPKKLSIILLHIQLLNNVHVVLFNSPRKLKQNLIVLQLN